MKWNMDVGKQYNVVKRMQNTETTIKNHVNRTRDLERLYNVDKPMLHTPDLHPRHCRPRRLQVVAVNSRILFRDNLKPFFTHAECIKVSIVELFDICWHVFAIVLLFSFFD